jgi:tripartite-type tricarboxylate transporter receptor subunit TctC
MYKKIFLSMPLAISCLASFSALAENFPNKPIRIVVPYAAGGTTDMLARVVGKHMSESLGQSVIVENKPGANGMLGSSMVAKSTPDGYTLGIATPGNHAANASLYKDVPYDTVKDFTAVSHAVNSPMVLIAHPDLGVKTVGELIDKAKKSPKTIVYASGGTGSSMHLAMEQFAKKAGIEMIHVPYKGSGNSYIDLLSGRVSLLIDITPQALPRIRSGELLALGVGAKGRLPELPNVPTIDQSGVPGYEAGSWYGFVAPAGVPSDVLAKLNGAINDALRNPSIDKQLREAGLQVVASTPQAFQSFIEQQVASSAQIIKDAGIKPE